MCSASSAGPRLAATRGFATFNLDRLGYGRSDHPDPMTLDLPAAGDVVHQVVDRLRGGLFGPRFAKVVLNAHSLGGLVAYETSRHGGVTAMIISGMPGMSGTRAAAEPFPPFYPAEQDPKFAGLPVPLPEFSAIGTSPAPVGVPTLSVLALTFTWLSSTV